MKSLFPAYGAGPSKDVNSVENKPTTGDQLGWLQNSSYTTQNVDVLASIAGAVNENEKKDEHEEIPDEDSLGVDAAQADIYEFPHLRVKRRSKSKHKHKKSKSRSRPKSLSPESLIQQTPTISESSSKKIFLEDVGLQPEHAFRIDRNSDRNNLAFSSLSHHQIPKYVRSLPRISETGVTNAYYWLPNIEAPTKGTSKSNRKGDRYYKSFKRLYNETNIIDLTKSRGSRTRSKLEDALKCTYLPLQSQIVDPEVRDAPKAQPEINSSNPLGIYDQNTTLYLQGKGISRENDEKAELEPRAKEEKYKETHDEYVQRMTTEYNVYVRENPHDVRKWIEFVKFQNDAAESTFGGFSDQLKTVKHRKVTESALLEKKLSILDRAIEHNPKSVELIVYKYDLSKDIWDTDKLSSEWRKIMFLHPNNTWLWQKYLLFFQTRFSAFTVTKFSKLYVKCFDMLKKIHGGQFQSHKPLPNMEEHMLEIFSKYCHVLCQSGYKERATANFQALIEFNFFPPKHLSDSAPLDHWLAFFEPFWDSGMPRFGENDARGWCEAMNHKQLSSTSQKSLDDENEDNIVKPDHSRWQNWLSLEKFREQHNWLPWRPTELEDECEDTDRMVLFDDVAPSIFRIQNDYSKFILLVRFLDMLGVRISPHYQATCKLLNCHEPHKVMESSEILDGHRLFVWRFYTSDRFASMLSLSALTCRTNAFQEFVDSVFRQSCSLLRGSYKQFMILLWVNCHFVKLRSLRGNVKAFKKQLKESKKFVKNFLKIDENRNNLALWCEYAKLEWWSKNFDEARKIFDLTLVTHSQTHGEWNKMEIEQKSSLCIVCSTYVALELGCDEDTASSEVDVADGAKRAFAILISLGTDAKFTPSSKETIQNSPALILKSKHQYEAVFQQLVKDYFDEKVVDQFELSGLHHQRHLLIDWTVCYAFFKYITDGFDAASTIFKTVLQRLTLTFSCSVAHDEDSATIDLINWSNSEYLYIHFVQLSVLHNNVCPSAPLSVLRNALCEALEYFPENQHFNNLLLDIEARSHIARRLRVHYDARLRDNSLPGCTSAIFAIVTELERQKNLMNSAALASSLEICASSPIIVETGITHRLRALFEKIVKNVKLRHCVLLWRLYINFEVMQSNHEHAKAIFYSAVQQCPWAKVLYLDAIEHFPDDIQEFNDILTEKEIRVRAPLEEIDLLMETSLPSKDNENISVNLEDICLPPSPALNQS